MTTSWRKSLLWLLFVSPSLLAGCGQFYWSRPAATFDEFAIDHRACVRAVGVSSGPRYDGPMPKAESIGAGNKAVAIGVGAVAGGAVGAIAFAAGVPDNTQIGTEAAGPNVVLVLPELYRECLKAHGWRRVRDGGNWTAPGLFRGVERESAVRLDSVPEQVQWYERMAPECRSAASSSDPALRVRCAR
jgi:hypothetical protein